MTTSIAFQVMAESGENCHNYSNQDQQNVNEDQP
jgi:hypothetical protein